MPIGENVWTLASLAVRAGVLVLLKGGESVFSFTSFHFSSIGQELVGCWLGFGAVVWVFLFLCLLVLSVPGPSF